MLMVGLSIERGNRSPRYDERVCAMAKIHLSRPWLCHCRIAIRSLFVADTTVTQNRDWTHEVVLMLTDEDRICPCCHYRVGSRPGDES